MTVEKLKVVLDNLKATPESKDELPSKSGKTDLVFVKDKWYVGYTMTKKKMVVGPDGAGRLTDVTGVFDVVCYCPSFSDLVRYAKKKSINVRELLKSEDLFLKRWAEVYQDEMLQQVWSHSNLNSFPDWALKQLVQKQETKAFLERLLGLL